jgi:hypothetical protein
VLPFALGCGLSSAYGFLAGNLALRLRRALPRGAGSLRKLRIRPAFPGEVAHHDHDLAVAARHHPRLAVADAAFDLQLVLGRAHLTTLARLLRAGKDRLGHARSGDVARSHPAAMTAHRTG